MSTGDDRRGGGAPIETPLASANGPSLPPEEIGRLVSAALAEDIGTGDITTRAIVPASARGVGELVAREAIVVCGLELAREAFQALDRDAVWEARAGDGDEVPENATIATITGRAGPILTAERTALNFLQRLSGIATLTRRAVREIQGTRARILDTRKTTPTLRAAEKYAVAVGGGCNHRFGLFDAVLVKDNHVALAGGVAEAVRLALASGLPPDQIEVEVDDLRGAREAIGSGATRLLLDNFSPEAVAEAVREIAGRARIEVSGGLRPGNLRAYALAGADDLSLGGLTHSAPAVDIALDLRRPA